MAKSVAPTVSVIVPNYNHAPYLRQRIESVLAQTYTDFELIFLDDASTDDSRRVLESYAAHPQVSHVVINELNSGSTFAQWRRGLALARGRYVWIAESDDFAHPDFLSALVPCLEENPSAVMAFSGSLMVDSHGEEIPGMDWDRWKPGFPPVDLIDGKELMRRKLLWTCDVYNASMVLFRRNAAPEITDAHTRMRYCGDWLFWAMLAPKGQAVEVRRKLNRFRQHEAKVSPGASRSGLYFTEGLPVMCRVADTLELDSRQRAMLAGRTWKRLGKFPQLIASHGDMILSTLDDLSPGASRHRRRLMLLYELDKYLNLTGLQM